MRTDAIHRQKGQREEHAVPQIRDAEHVSERFEEFVHVLLCSLAFDLAATGRAEPAPTKPFVLLRYDLERTAGFADLIFGGLAEGVGVNRDLHGQFAVAENFDLVGLAANEAVGAKQAPE